MLELPPDITYYLQIVVFLVFAMLLQPLVFAPVQRVLAERAKRTTGAESEAAAMREQAGALKHEFEVSLEAARRKAAAESDKIRREAEEVEERLLAEARAEAAKVLDEVRRRVASEMEQARVALRAHAAPLAKEAAEKILGRAVTS